MQQSTKDQTVGRFPQMEGKNKVVAVGLNDNPKLLSESAGEKTAGNVQEKIDLKTWYAHDKMNFYNNFNAFDNIPDCDYKARIARWFVGSRTD